MPPKRTRSRKAQLRELAAAKRQRRSERKDDSDADEDEEYEPHDAAAADGDDASNEALEGDQPGAQHLRDEAARRQRRRANFVRGVSVQAAALRGWLAQAEPVEADDEEEAGSAQATQVAQAEEVASPTEADKALHDRELRAQRAAQERARYATRKAEAVAMTPRQAVQDSC